MLKPSAIAIFLSLIAFVQAGDAGADTNGGGHKAWVAGAIIGTAVVAAGGYNLYRYWCNHSTDETRQLLRYHHLAHHEI